MESYIRDALQVAREIKQAGLSLEILVVANDASEQERDLLDNFAKTADISRTATVCPLYVERETLYASWNRGVRASSGYCLGFWNIDDIRYADAIIEGYSLLQKGYNLVDFPIQGLQTVRRLGLFPAEKRQVRPVPFSPTQFTRKNGMGPFSLMTRELYEQVGPFDENFRIVGDLEWGGRAMAHVNFHPGENLGGAFRLHGENLSSTGSIVQAVEDNIVFMRRGDWAQVYPTSNPQLMREAWQNWGDNGVTVPDAVQEMLWGESAVETWEQHQRERRSAQFGARIRSLPRAVIDATGLRPMLARLGIVKDR